VRGRVTRRDKKKERRSLQNWVLNVPIDLIGFAGRSFGNIRAEGEKINHRNSIDSEILFRHLFTGKKGEGGNKRKLTHRGLTVLQSNAFEHQ